MHFEIPPGRIQVFLVHYLEIFTRLYKDFGRHQSKGYNLEYKNYERQDSWTVRFVANSKNCTVDIQFLVADIHPTTFDKF